MPKETFGSLLTRERESLGFSIRKLAGLAGLNPGYLSRLEAGKITPQEENLIKLADVFGVAAGQGQAARETYRRRFADAAGRVPKKAEQISKIKDEFEAILKLEGLAKAEIQSALEAVSLPTMIRVIRGEEPLTIMRHGDPRASAAAIRDREDEIVVIAQHESEFKAGSRASIRIMGALGPEQQAQIRIIAKLIESIVE